MMHWYTAKLIIAITVGPDNQSMQLDEQVRIIRADNLPQAYVKAVQIGEKQEDIFLNHCDKRVEYKFLGIIDLYELPVDELVDGMEIHSEIKEPLKPHLLAEMLDWIKVRSTFVRDRAVKDMAIVDVV